MTINEDTPDDIIEEEAAAQLPLPPSVRELAGGGDDDGYVSASPPSQGQLLGALEWSDISMSIIPKRNSDEPPKMVLDHVWGQARPGETTAIMGASGAGKTSLFHVLAGRLVSNKNVLIEGTVRLGGTPIDPSQRNIQKQFAFVAQQDSLNKTSTVRESFLFSAKLRLPRRATTATTEASKNSEKTDDTEHQMLVSTLLEDLGLTSSADTLVSKLSGGERRRTSIGVELISNPKIIFLDEPTSGLDSTSARQVLELLEKVAKLRGSKSIVLFTVHQPSSQVFGTFDRLLLLHRGRLMYQGIGREISDNFESRQYPIPNKYNPADWILVSTIARYTRNHLANWVDETNTPNRCHVSPGCGSERANQYTRVPWILS
jgi:ABC-type multidrug transport system ATPase subunit